MYCDSEATPSKVYNSIYNGKSPHIGLRHNYVRQLIENGTISIVYIKSYGNLADPLTKPLTRGLIGSTTRDLESARACVAVAKVEAEAAAPPPRFVLKKFEYEFWGLDLDGDDED
ncbi:hypothetical protein OSB04_011808 [Centaurea solstitialis]|uniref:Zinc finger, CCHC-type n=1 Tax=Centaurea solstitialis TaxID=347529 RepID=A0AA38WPH4_9ASTR|nr:hypothetical protein OSB04_011808 [Centaurea solstitialis]